MGGALFALEVMRGMLALRYVLPALFASLVATAVSWLALPDARRVVAINIPMFRLWAWDGTHGARPALAMNVIVGRVSTTVIGLTTVEDDEPMVTVPPPYRMSAWLT